MKLNFLVHDCFPEIGHTRAMLEVIRKIDSTKLEKLRVICFTSASAEELYPEHPEKVEIKRIPMAGLKPFILKSIFFQLYTWFFKKRLLLPKAKTITMGVCSFVGDIVNIQFSHKLWEKLYFKTIPTSPLKKIYKKILLRYLSLCEEHYYRKQGLQFVFLSEFMAQEMVADFQIEPKNYRIAYSSADITTFGPDLRSSRLELIAALKKSYPQLSSIDEEKPILLFVGAFERKGLPSIVEKVGSHLNFIVVGKGEKGSLFTLPEADHIFHIDFTKEIAKFFNICDAFIFPTSFEPFGLVVLEAYASGTKILVSEHMVGATEIIKGSAGVNLIEADEPELPEVVKLSTQERELNFKARKEVLNRYTWKACTQEWESILTFEPL